jgi:hypothetical protein
VIQSRHAPYVCASKEGPMHQWLPTNYRLTTEDVCLIMNDWEDGWKTPAEKIGHPKDEEMRVGE